VVIKNSTEFWVVTLCSLEKPNVSEEHITSSFRVTAQAQQETNKKQAVISLSVVTSLAYSLSLKIEVHLHGRISQARNQRESRWQADYMALYPRR
jgi:hypothetical protein